MNRNEKSVAILSPEMAIYEIVQNESDFRLLHDDGFVQHKLGFAEKELFILNQGGMDDPWLIQINEKGRWVEKSNDFKIDNLGEFKDWVGNSRAKDGYNLLNLLPTGKYYLIKSKLTPRYDEWVFLGNVDEEVKENIYNLICFKDPMHKQGEYWLKASIFGNKENHPPDFNQPLLGIPITHYDTCIESIGVLFFSFSSASNKKEYENLPLLLVLPMSTDLVSSSRAYPHTDDRIKEIWEPNAEMIAYALRG